MANKIKLGARPKTFKTIEVAVTMPDGFEGVIPVNYVYRTKKEFGRWLDEAAEKSKQKTSPAVDGSETTSAPPVEFSWEKFYEQNTEGAVEQLLGAIDSWELDTSMNRAALLQLGDEAPATIIALLGAYGSACREGRLGN